MSTTVTESTSITQYQRGEIVRLMRKAELDTRRITLMHRRIGVPDSFMDQSVEHWMCFLSQDAANVIINKLRGLL